MYNFASVLPLETQVSTNNMLLATVMGHTAGSHIQPQVQSGLEAFNLVKLINNSGRAPE